MAKAIRSAPVVDERETRAVSTSAAGVPIRYDQSWLTSVLRPSLIALMVAAIDWVVLSFVARVAPVLSHTYIPAMVVISVGAAVIGCISTAVLAQPEQRHRRTFGYRMAELGMLLVVTRLAIWVVTGLWPSTTQMLTQPLSTLLDGLFVVGGMVVTFSWIMATDISNDLLRMALQPDELYAIEADRIGEMVRTSNTDRPAILRGLVSRWVVGGILLVLFAAGLGLDFSSGRSLFTMDQAAVGPGVVAAIVVYFLGGLVLISHGQLAILRSRWTIDRVPSAAAVLRNWPVYVLLLLGLIGLIASLLPFGGTFRLAQILAFIFTTIFSLLLDFFRLIMAFLMMLISLFTGDAPPQEAPPPPPPVQPVMPEVLEQAGGFPEWLGGAVFWVGMALLLGYAAYIYFSGRGFTFAWLTALWRLLAARWRLFRGAYAAWVHTRLPSRARDEEGTDGARQIPLSRWRLGDLNAAQRIRYFFLTTIERAEQGGLARRQGETPRQFAARLAERLATTPEAEQPEPEVIQAGAEHTQAVQTLTEAFVRVRYSKRQVGDDEASRLQQIWQKIRDRLHV